MPEWAVSKKAFCGLPICHKLPPTVSITIDVVGVSKETVSLDHCAFVLYCTSVRLKITIKTYKYFFMLLLLVIAIICSYQFWKEVKILGSGNSSSGFFLNLI